MLIDWFTVIAQIVNFLILVWLLKRFLYKPILRAIDQREKKIANQLAEANKTRSEAELLSEEYRQKNEDFDRRLADQELEVKEKINEKKQQLLEQARQEAENLRQKQNAILHRESTELDEAFRRRMGEVITAVAAKALHDLSDEELEDRIINVFIQQLKATGPAKLAALRPPVTGTEPIVITSSNPLSSDRRQQLIETIHKTFSSENPIRFTTDASLVCGLAVTWGGFMLAWNLADYLESLDKHLESILHGDIQNERNDGDVQSTAQI